MPPEPLDETALPGRRLVAPRPGLAPGGTFAFLAPPRDAAELGRFHGYRVLRALGVGGMGIVFEAEEIALRRPVALKVLKPELAADAENRERFLREARAAAGVESEYVVPIYHIEEDSDPPYMAMQLLQGESLQERLERPPRMDSAAVVLVAKQIALGLKAAHLRGMIHRDIKPANIWLESDGPGGGFRRVRILDFGLARHTHGETHLTATGFIVGTPNYMAPEQASAREVDARADLFSLGCVMYAMLTGRLPFEGDSVMAVMMALANTIPPPVNVRNATVPVELSDIVARLLAKDPDQRYESAGEVIDALEGVAAAANAASTAVLPTMPAKLERHTSGKTQATSSADTWPSRMVPSSDFPSKRTRRFRWYILLAAVMAVALAAVGAVRWLSPSSAAGGDAIRVGVLHSQTGVMAISEEPVIDATQMAIDEVNAAGGVLGRPLRAIIENGDSDPDVFERKAGKLYAEDDVPVIFGCWTSAARKTVKRKAELHKKLLFYPVQYEGLEQSPWVVYLGAAPNQQLVPAIEFLVKERKKRAFYLVGSDYVFPQTAHVIIRDQIDGYRKQGLDVSVLSESFVPLSGPMDMVAVATDIMHAEPDVIVNTINGGANVEFFQTLRNFEAKTPGKLRRPVMSVSITENELQAVGESARGDYVAASYFQCVDTAASREFAAKLQARFGKERVVSDTMASAYAGVHLWAWAANAAGSTDPEAVRAKLRGAAIDAPGGRLTIDPETQHAWLPARIGQVQPDGQLKLVGGSAEPLKPMPYPPTRTPAAWDGFLKELNNRWGGKWVAPAKP